MGFNIKENLNQDKFIKKYNLQEVKNPIFFSMNNIPTPDGLLSNEIFGVTPKDRQSTFAYINLSSKFFHPSIYEELKAYDNKFLYIVSSLRKYKLVNGKLIEDENGDTGLTWLIKIFKDIDFTNNSSRNKQILANSIIKYQKQKYFMDKLIISPPFYRDIDTSKGFISIGEVNKLYSEVIRLSKSIQDTDELGINLKNTLLYKMQELLLDIFNYYMNDKYEGGSSDTIRGKDGAIYRTALKKNIRYSSRLVLSQPNNNADHWSEIEVDLDTTLVPLPSAASQLFPFVLFSMKNFFNNLVNGEKYEALDKNNKPITITIKDIDEDFSEENLKKYLSRFIHSNSNRFASIPIKNEEGKIAYMKTNIKSQSNDKVISRRLTWTDIIYIATVEASDEKYTLSTRYPMDTAFNQVVHKIKVGSTNKTIKAYNIRKYDNYPDIKPEDVDTNTENAFKETCNISNATIGSMGGDYDGDTSNNKATFSNEANLECKKFLESKARSINMKGELIYGVDNESILVGYTLTKCNDESKLSTPTF